MLPQSGSCDGALAPRFSMVARALFSLTYQVGTETVKSCLGFGPSITWLVACVFSLVLEDMRYDWPRAIFHFRFCGGWMLSSLGIASWPGWIVSSHINLKSMSTNCGAFVTSRVCMISCPGSIGWTGIHFVPGLFSKYLVISGVLWTGRYSLVLSPVLVRNPYLKVGSPFL